MDPREWATTIATDLLAYDRSRLKERHDQLILDHQKKTGETTGFLAGGKFFTHLKPSTAFHVKKSPVHPDLRDDALDWLSDNKQCDKEEQQIRTGVYQLLQHCKDLQDVRDALPEAVVKSYPELSTLSRTRAEAWPLKHSPILMHSWDIVSSTILTRYSSVILN